MKETIVENDLSKTDIGIYLLHNPNTDQIYVGSGILKSRKANHFASLKNNHHCNYKLQRAFNKDANFEFIPVVLENREEALNVEQELINYFWGNPLFLNLAKDAIAPMYGKATSEETKKKISSALKGVPTGSRQTPESIEKIKEANRGNAYRLGKTHTLESKALMSKASAERMEDPLQREQISQALTGRIISPEVIETMTKASIAYAATPEGMLKMQKMNAACKLKNSKPVIVDSVEYPSLTDAALAHNLSKNAAHNRVTTSSEKFRNWNYAQPIENKELDVNY